MHENPGSRQDHPNSPSAPKPALSAAEAYAAHRHDISWLLDVIGMELERMDRGEKTWGAEASLAKVRSDLVNLAGFLSNKDPEEVEEFLKDSN